MRRRSTTNCFLLKVFCLIEFLNQVVLGSQVFKIVLYENSDGIGRHQDISVNSNETCTRLPDTWRNSVGAVGLEKHCVRFWEDNECQGSLSRCYCDSRFLSLDETFRMSRNNSWNRKVRGLSSCLSMNNRDGDDRRQEDVTTLVWLFSQENFKGNMTTIVLAKPGECFAFPEGDKWHGYGRSSWLFQGCVKYFKNEDCTGKSLMLSSSQSHIKDTPQGFLKSVQNCALDEEIVNKGWYLKNDNKKHGVGVYIYPRGFLEGLPWTI